METVQANVHSSKKNQHLKSPSRQSRRVRASTMVLLWSAGCSGARPAPTVAVFLKEKAREAWSLGVIWSEDKLHFAVLLVNDTSTSERKGSSKGQVGKMKKLMKIRTPMVDLLTSRVDKP
ncbi:hypothetical protein L218DRAFT_193949 [Marasmius fiardii PR-910]|nr:hypothetical protein L218DRAFT_193949 [Marasmius fiardii PR-910]